MFAKKKRFYTFLPFNFFRHDKKSIFFLKLFVLVNGAYICLSMFLILKIYFQDIYVNYLKRNRIVLVHFYVMICFRILWINIICLSTKCEGLKGEGSVQTAFHVVSWDWKLQTQMKMKNSFIRITSSFLYLNMSPTD